MRVALTCDDRTTGVPKSCDGGPAAAERYGANTNGPAPSPSPTASARRFSSAARSDFRISHAVGPSTASGSCASISATSSGAKASPAPEGARAACVGSPAYVSSPLICSGPVPSSIARSAFVAAARAMSYRTSASADGLANRSNSLFNFSNHRCD